MPEPPALKAGEEALQGIWAAVAAIPPGRVESYGSIARRAGLAGRARLVGHALKQAPEELALPWHRVINASGRISFPEGSRMHVLQRRLLEEEGVRFNGAVVAAGCRHEADLDELLWAPLLRGPRRRRMLTSRHGKSE